MDRHKPLKRSGPIRRRARMKSSTPKGRAKRAKQCGDDTGFGDFLRGFACVGCAPRSWRQALRALDLGVPGLDLARRLDNDRPVVVAHLVTRGAGHGVVTAHATKCGRPAGTPCVVPLCPGPDMGGVGHHDEQEGRTAQFSQEIGVDLWTVAAALAVTWEAEA